MTAVYFEYEQSTWVTDEGDPPDVEWGNRESTDGDYVILSAHLSPGARDMFESTEEVHEGDTVYVVYVVYGDGDTFGRSGGYSKILAVTHDKDAALKAEAWIPTASWDRHRHEGTGSAWLENRPGNPGWPDSLGPAPYPDWSGYFNWVHRTACDEFVVKP